MITHDPPPPPKKSSWWLAMLPPAACSALLIFLMPRVFQWHPRILDPSVNRVYRMDHGAWRQLPELPGMPERVRVTERGTVWAMVWRSGIGNEMARLDGSAWRLYGKVELGESGPDTWTGFVVDGDEVWAPSSGALLHWDGAKWILHRNDASKGWDASLAATTGQAWLVDNSGVLSHFDGKQWSQQKLDLPGVTWGDDDQQPPELAHTRDGALWMVRGGVWRSPGTQPVDMKALGEDLEFASLVGAGAKTIWLWSRRSLISVGPSGIERRFTAGEIGLSRRAHLFEVDERGGRIWAATGDGVREFDGTEWHAIASPASVGAIASVAAGPGGELIGVGNSPNPFGQRFGFILRFLPLTFALAMLAMPVWFIRVHKRLRLQEHLRLRQAVEHATGEVPDAVARDERLLTRQSTWWSATIAAGEVFGAAVAYGVARVFWPKLPSWFFLVLAIVLHVVITLFQSLIRRTPKPWDPIEPGGPRFDWEPTRKAIPGALLMFVLLNFGEVWRRIGDPVVWILYGVGAWVVFRTLEAAFLNSAIYAGDYERALRVGAWFHWLRPNGAMALFRRGHILVLMGRYREAEEALRRALAGARADRLQALILEYLGEAISGQGRFQEAMRSYEAAIQAYPRRPWAYRGMAEAMLRQSNAQRALEYVEKLHGKPADDYWSIKAWALAELGRGAEADKAAAEAIRSTKQKSKPDVAGTNRRLGLAMWALGRMAEGEQYLRKAVDADPRGRWSATAKEALRARPALRA
jgi:tetratricopeptide (TPR) repeat protein